MNIVDKIKFYKFNKYRKFKNQICYGPNVGLEFYSNGDVRICCTNWYFKAGNLLKENIDNIWNGEKLNTFREYLKNYDLSYGCQFCDECIKTKNFHKTEIYSFDKYVEDKKSANIKVIKFETSYACNLKCKMCPLHLKKNYSNQIYNDSFLSHFSQFIDTIKQVKLLGGEPFIIPFYEKVINLILEKNKEIEIFIQTNGTILNDKIKNYLQNGDFLISISIDSLKKEKFEYIREGACFDTVMSNFDYFLEYSKSKGRYLNVNICPLQQNWEEIPDMMNFFNEKMVTVFFNNVDFPIHYSLRGYSSEKLLTIKNYLVKHTPDFNSFHLNIYAYSSLIKYIDSIIKTNNIIEKKIKKTSSTEQLLEAVLNSYKKSFNKLKIPQEEINNNILKLKEYILTFEENKLIDVLIILYKTPDYLRYLILDEEDYSFFKNSIKYYLYTQENIF